MNLKDLVFEFKKFLKTDEGLSWENDRNRRRELYRKLLDIEHIDHLSKEEFSRIIKSLWASNVWRNKDWLVNKILEDNNGIEKIRISLKELLYGKGSLSERYDLFVTSIKRIGPSMLTEIMAFTEPEKYCIWNDKPKAVLPFLKMDKNLPSRVFKYQITGEEYEKCIEILSEIRNALRPVFKKPDFIDVDLFLAYIFYRVLPEAEEGKEKQEDLTLTKPVVSSHEKAQKALIELGTILGFDTYVPPEDRSKKIDDVKIGHLTSLKDLPPFTYKRLLDTVKHIDVIWFKEEFPVFCFEVEDSTDVTKGLLRLYQIRQLNIRPIIVGPESRRKKFEIEIEKDPFYRIKERYRFISYEELSRLLKTAKEFLELKERLLGD